MRRIILAVLAGLACSSCATEPAPMAPIVTSRVYDRPMDGVWSNVVEYFATTNTSIKTIEKASGVMFAERVNYPIEEVLASPALAQCDFLIKEGNVTVQINAFVKEVAPGKTQVTVNTTWVAHHPAMLSREWDYTNCPSTGLYEQHLLDWVAKKGS